MIQACTAEENPSARSCCSTSPLLLQGLQGRRGSVASRARQTAYTHFDSAQLLRYSWKRGRRRAIEGKRADHGVCSCAWAGEAKKNASGRSITEYPRESRCDQALLRIRQRHLPLLISEAPTQLRKRAFSDGARSSAGVDHLAAEAVAYDHVRRSAQLRHRVHYILGRSSNAVGAGRRRRPDRRNDAR